MTTATGRPAAIRAEGLVKNYGDVRAVDDVSFTVGAGEFFGILGPNGAGKTTTLEMVEGIREPDAGAITLLGEPVWPRNPRLLSRIGVQLQASAFFDRLTCREQLQTFGEIYGVSRRRADQMLELVGLTEKADVREDQLSGGQRQRLSIACSLIHEPEVVFLDEPTAALDPQARRKLWDVLREIQATGTTVVYTTHYMDEAEILCDRVAIMDAGRILDVDTPANLVRGLQAPTRVALPAGTIDLASARELPGADAATETDAEIVVSTREPAQLVGALAARDALDGVSVRTATLEDVFLTLTGREYRA